MIDDNLDPNPLKRRSQKLSSLLGPRKLILILFDLIHAKLLVT